MSEFSVLEKKYHDEVYHFCQILVGNTPDATECQRQAFHLLKENYQSLANDELAKDRVYEYARNICLSWLKQREGLQAQQYEPLVENLRVGSLLKMSKLGAQVDRITKHLEKMSECTTEGYDLALVGREDDQDIIRLDSRFAQQDRYVYEYVNRGKDLLNELTQKLSVLKTSENP